MKPAIQMNSKDINMKYVLKCKSHNHTIFLNREARLTSFEPMAVAFDTVEEANNWLDYNLPKESDRSLWWIVPRAF